MVRLLFRLSAFFPVFALAASAQAASVSLMPTLSGKLDYELDVSFFPPSVVINSESVQHSGTLDTLSHHTVASSTFCCFTTQENGYLAYDLSTVDFTVGKASITVDLDANLLNSPGTVSVHELQGYTTADLASLPDGTLPLAEGKALHSALESGPLFGAADIGVGAATYTFELNGAALASINSGEEALLLGLVRPSGLFDPITFINTPSLHLSEVPLPPAVWLLGSALLGLGIVKRKKG